MRGTSELVKVVSEWIFKAENDLKTAAHTLKIKSGCPTDTVCFHAQQCVEKYLKALLIYRDIDFPKTHDISNLVARLPEDILISLTAEEQERLTEYATAMRYPGGYESISISEAKEAVGIARRIRREIRSLLPKEAVRPRN